jgi:hypothetical protein
MPPYDSLSIEFIQQQHHQQHCYTPSTTLLYNNNNTNMGGTAIDEFLERNATKKNNASSWPSFSVLQQSDVFLELDPAEMVDIDMLFSETTLKEPTAASSRTKTTSCCTLKKHVSFTEINIREHSVVLGDHPCCTIGLPVALGWDVQHESSQSLDDYEASRTKRRSRHEMRLSLTDRRALLSDYSDDTVRRVSRQLHKERRVMGRRAKQQFFSHHDTASVVVVAAAAAAMVVVVVEQPKEQTETLEQPVAVGSE